jgi:hypothetical protein
MMSLSIIKKSPNDVLVKDLLKGLLLEGAAEVDILGAMAKAGIPNDMARSMVLRVTEEMEVEGLGTQRSIVRAEIDSSLFEWGKGFEAKIDEKLEGFSGNLDTLKAELDGGKIDGEKFLKEIEVIKANIKELNSSIKSFEVLAGEILKELKKK